jgi:hypothetical protein
MHCGCAITDSEEAGRSSEDQPARCAQLSEAVGREVGRLYEDRHSRPELRWFWSITAYVNPKLGIATSGRAASLKQAKTQFLINWQRCAAAASNS